MIRNNTIFSTCRSIVDRFVGAAEAFGNDSESFVLRKSNDIYRLDGLLQLCRSNDDRYLSMIVERHLDELRAYDFVNFWADRGFNYSLGASK